MFRFWIDVGGTFTDSIAIDAAGHEFVTKVLSTGVIPGTWPDTAEPTGFTSETLRYFGSQFFVGYRLAVIDRSGVRIAERRVTDYDERVGRLVVDSPLKKPEWSSASRFELTGGEPAPILAVRRTLQWPLDRELPPLQMCLGTTRGTNVLLTRTGARVALVTTRGFGDLLAIGEQDRPHLFELTIRKPAPLYAAVVEVDERVTASGEVLTRPVREQVIGELIRLRQKGITSLAVAFLHGYRYPEHEGLVGQWAHELGFAEVSLSHRVAPAIKLVPRSETTVLDAYLNPVIRAYGSDLHRRLGPQSGLEFMGSHGGLVAAANFTGKDSVLSGPAGGVVGFARVAEQLGFARAIGFDMGGTSTDVARYDGRFELDFESRKAGVRIAAPLMAIETVAAGGGSVCDFNGTQLTVGPASAGADPGPACYGRGGPLTVTDVNLFLGTIADEQFPFPLDRSAVEARLDAWRLRLQSEVGLDYSLLELALGWREIANRNMAAAVHTVSVARGYDPRGDVLVAFGGAGPQHATQVAELLNMTNVLIHPLSSILSAVGIRWADRTWHVEQPVLRVADRADVWASVADTLSELRQRAVAELHQTWPEATAVTTRGRLALRYAGTETALDIEEPSDGDFSRVFHSEHERRYGYRQSRALEIVAARVEAIAPGLRLASYQAPERMHTPHCIGQLPMAVGGKMRAVPYFDWAALTGGATIQGPALVLDPLTTVVVDDGWTLTAYEGRQLWLQRRGGGEAIHHDPARASGRGEDTTALRADPIQLEIFNNRFTSIAREMGIVLQRTAVSVNIRDRLDFSCALFNGDGDLVVNAPHIPVHLGAMSESVKDVIRSHPGVQPGDAFITNDPYRGGSHLPDVTVVTPVYIDGLAGPAGWVASRGHHAEIGGQSPGSMPPAARCLADEGTVISCIKLIDRGRDRMDEVESLLRAGPFPSRAVADNLADIRAQVAANRRGADRLAEFIAEQSWPRVAAYLQFVQDATERHVREALRLLPDGSHAFQDQMDSGAVICLVVDKHDDSLVIDFAGTSPVQPDNLNANRAIVIAATMYVMRCLLGVNVPLNQGVLRPVTIRLPECFLNPRPGSNPQTTPAVVGGNVETSQRIVDCLLGALGLAAASQGTMNNWLMGNARFGYYETLGGGAGATPQGPGADAVHTHMSNTRLTDPEVLETRFPVRLRRLAIRRGSGGIGRHGGGQGMIREIEFLEPLTVSLLTSRRTTAPFGMCGGGPGQSGVNRLVRAGGASAVLRPSDQIEVAPGDRLVIETPGGGAWGAASDSL